MRAELRKRRNWEETGIKEKVKQEEVEVLVEFPVVLTGRTEVFSESRSTHCVKRK
jgi:hypothetical protein